MLRAHCAFLIQPNYGSGARKKPWAGRVHGGGRLRSRSANTVSTSPASNVKCNVKNVSHLSWRFKRVFLCDFTRWIWKKFPQTPLTLKISISRSKMLWIFFFTVFPIFSTSMTLEIQLQFSLMPKMKCDLDCRFSRSRIPQWCFVVFFSYSVHQIT